jgi:ornithine cyclodeaminase
MNRLGAVRYIGVETMLALIRLRGTEAFLAGLALAIEHDFKRWEQFEKSPRLPSYSEEGVIELMPTSDGEFYAFKYVNGHPGNTGRGLPTVAGFGVLADVRTGLPVLFSEMTIATAMRTAATSAMAAKYLARPNSKMMALIGLGAQAEFQALAFKAIVGVTRIRAFDIDPGAARKFVANLDGLGIEIHLAGSVREATRGADIITTATARKGHQQLVTPDMVRPGVHFNAIGGDGPGKTELHPDALSATKIFVEYSPQTRIEGEIQQAPPGGSVTELWRVIAGTAAGRTSDADVTLFDSVGFAIEDFSTLRYLRGLLDETGLGEPLDIVPFLEDPKDLFGLLKGGR